MDFLQPGQWFRPRKKVTDGEDRRPLLQSNLRGNNTQDSSGDVSHSLRTFAGSGRKLCRNILSSKFGHLSVLALVTVDVACIFADILIELHVCGLKSPDRGWSVARKALAIASLSISCLFVVELIISLWALGWSYFKSKFRCFDGFVIIAGFVIDAILHGVLEEIASLVVVLRLWRVLKIIDELGAGAAERMESFEQKIEELERENQRLRNQLM